MVRIITDSTSDISEEKRKELGIDVLPLTVTFGTERYKDGVELSKTDFYDKLEKADRLPTTAQLTPAELESVFSRYIGGGDEVVGLFLSSHPSGTFQSALIARENIGGEHIYLVDTNSVTFPMAMLVIEAVKMRDSGVGAAVIAENIERLSKRLRLFAAVDTLKYLKKGGRLSGTAAFVGGLLGIMPIVSITDGRVSAVGKARGRRGAMEHILKELKKDPPDLTCQISFGHSNSPEAAVEFIDYIGKNLNADIANAYVGEIGCIVGTHVGPGAFGIAYFAKE